MSDEKVEEDHHRTLFKWFHEQYKNDDDNNLKFLARGPHRDVISYKGFIVKGYRFHTNKQDLGKVTQSAGVLVKGSNYENDEQDYYGHLVEVIEVHYFGGNTVFLFKCEWYDSKKGQEVDKYGFNKVNTKSRLRSYEPFVIASQVVQVFYADPVSKKSQVWSTVITSKARNTYDVMENDDEDPSTYQEDEVISASVCDFDHEGGNILLLDNNQPGVEVEIVGEDDDNEGFLDDDDEGKDDDDDDGNDDDDDDDILNDFDDTSDDESDNAFKDNNDNTDEDEDSDNDC